MGAEFSIVGTAVLLMFILDPFGNVPLLLAILKEKYTCYPSVEDEIKKEGYQGDNSMVVADDNVMTSRGPATAICFALAIVKQLKGEKVYDTIRSGVLAEYCV